MQALYGQMEIRSCTGERGYELLQKCSSLLRRQHFSTLIPPGSLKVYDNDILLPSLLVTISSVLANSSGLSLCMYRFPPQGNTSERNPSTSIQHPCPASSVQKELSFPCVISLAATTWSPFPEKRWLFFLFLFFLGGGTGKPG